MISDSVLQLYCWARPVSLAGLMTLYESNYLRLSWLMPNIRSAHGEWSSDVPGHEEEPELMLRFIDRVRYTSTLWMSYRFSDSAGPRFEPGLTVKLYHDARMAEVLVDSVPGREKRGEIERRWTRNIMLNKWLEYCSESGHRLTPAESVLENE